jgi:TonB-linked SusC/RagA family outer membrane protein
MFLETHCALSKRDFIRMLLIAKITFILILATCLQASAKLNHRNLLPPIEIHGRVINQEGHPLQGVSVVIAGTHKGATTNVDGNFTLVVIEANTKLEISNVGFQSRTVNLGNQTEITITLENDIAGLSDVVVVGYGTQRKKDITGSVAIVDMSALKSVPSGSAVQALQGQASGVNIIRSGVPGGASNIFIRGISSFGNTQPLVMVDGVESNLDNISANDIETMQVLKDAGAAAIYGVRGSNGVIIVTTKKGKIGKPIISYDAYYGIQQPLPGNVFNLLNSEDFARLTKQVNPNTALFKNGLPDFLYRGPTGAGVAMVGDPSVDPSKYNLDPSNSSNNYLIQKVNKIGTDWFHALFQNAPMQNHNVTVSGANEKSSYLLSLGYFDQQGTMIETLLKRYSARVNTSYKVNNNIRMGENIYFYYKQNKSMDDGNPISWTYREMPIIPVYDIKGNFGGTFAGPELGSSSNAVAIQRNTINDKFNTWNIVGNAYAEADFLKKFTIRTSFGGTVNNTYNTNFNFTPYNNTEGNNNPNSFSESAGYNSNTIWTNTVSYNNHFAKHDLKVIVGSEAVRNYGRTVGGARQGFFSSNIDYLILSNGTSNVTNSGSAYVNTLFSLFGRIDYSYNDRYLLGVTVRRDGSSVFGSDKRFGVFPSFSAGWRISKENVLKDISWLNDMKIRGSYGILGSQNNVSPQNAFSLYGGGFGNAYYDIAGSTNSIQQGFFQTTIGNPRTSWEQDIISNIGFDATLLNNRINFSVEYYKKSIKGLLFSQPLPATVGGATAPTVNIGDIQNTGIDMSASYDGTINKDFQYKIGANVTTYKNLVVRIPGPGYFDAASTQVLGNVVRNQVGHPVSSFFGYDVIGLFSDAGDVAKSPTQTDAAPGRFKYRDVNGDGKITPSDRTFIGNPNPEFTYGLNVGISYKRFDIAAIVYGSQGNDVHNQIRNYTDFFSTYDGGKSNVTLNAWTPQNTNTKVPRIETQGSFSSSGVANSYYIEDGSYLRLNTLSIGYTPSVSFLQNYGIKKFRIYFQAANLFTITGYSGLDPELGGSSAAFGVDYANYPNNQKNFLIGLNVSF